MNQVYTDVRFLVMRMRITLSLLAMKGGDAEQLKVMADDLDRLEKAIEPLKG